MYRNSIIKIFCGLIILFSISSIICPSAIITKVYANEEKNNNYILNPSFEETDKIKNPTHWELWTNAGNGDAVKIISNQNPHSGLNHLKIYKKTQYQAMIWQNIEVPKPDYYTVKVWVKSSGNFNSCTLALGKNALKISLLNSWTQIILPDCYIPTTQTTVSIWVDAKPGNSLEIDDFELTPSSATHTIEANKTIQLVIGNPFMSVDGEIKEIDPGRNTCPVVVKNRTLLPIRRIIEELGGNVVWDDKTRTSTINLKNNTIILDLNKIFFKQIDLCDNIDSIYRSALIAVGNKFISVNGSQIESEIPPIIYNDRTYMPVRFIIEQLGYSVEWHDQTKTIIIK